MTSLAFCWSWLVEEHQCSIHGLFEGVAGRAGNVLMSAFEREGRLLVIEERRTPLVAVVARGTVAGLRPELVCMGVFVALVAALWSTRKVHMEHRQLHVRRLVAFDAGYAAMGADQREICLRVVELGYPRMPPAKPKFEVRTPRARGES